MSELQLFSFEGGSEIRTQVDEKGEPLVCALDLARYLGLKKPENAYGRIKEKYRITRSTGDRKPLVFLTEPGVYQLLLSVRTRKNNPNHAIVEKFQEWIFEDVLPSLRKTRKYEIPQLAQKTAAFKEGLEFAKLVGLDGNQAILTANNLVISNLDCDMLKESKLVLPSLDNEELLTVTKIGKRLQEKCGGPERSGQYINQRLEELGYQVKKAGDWCMTEKGREYGVLIDGRYNGVNKQGLRWKESFITTLETMGV